MPPDPILVLFPGFGLRVFHMPNKIASKYPKIRTGLFKYTTDLSLFGIKRSSQTNGQWARTLGISTGIIARPAIPYGWLEGLLKSYIRSSGLGK